MFQDEYMFITYVVFNASMFAKENLFFIKFGKKSIQLQDKCDKKNGNI